MANIGLATSIILVYLMVDIFLFAGGIADTSDNWMFEHFVTVEGNDPLANSTIERNQNMSILAGVEDSNSTSTGAGLPGSGTPLWLETLGYFWNGLIALFSFIFAPVFVLQRIPNIPFVIVLAVGVVPVVAIVLAILQAIGGRQV